MRLNRLDLTRYGKFTGKSISFGEKVSGKTDLHLIYGLNEAGKSTLFSANLDRIRLSNALCSCAAFSGRLDL